MEKQRVICLLVLISFCCDYSISFFSEGKLAIAENTGKFNKEASQKYKELLPQEKEKLKKESELCVKMDLSGILREAEKIFQKIQKLVSAIELQILFLIPQ